MTVLAQGGTGSPPAGGGEIGQVIFGTIGAMIMTAVMFYLVLGHRAGRVKLLTRLGALLRARPASRRGARCRSACCRARC